MGQIYVSLKPFKDDLGTEYEDGFTDVTEFLTRRGLKAIKQQLDNTEFDIGIFRHAHFDLELNNSDGFFSKPGSTGTLFNFKRNNSIMRIEWEANSRPFPLGFNPAGRQVCSPKQLIGDFLLQDIPAKGSSTNQTVKFKCLGYSTLFERELVPFSSISNGDLLSVVIFTCLNQTSITRHLTISQSNIVVANDVTIDDKTLGDLENKTVMEALKKILLFGNSVLYIEQSSDGSTAPVVKVSARTESTDLKFTFTGPGSVNQLENIVDVENDNDGENRIINFVDVPDTSFSATDATSKSDNGLRKKSISFKPVSDQTKSESACQAIVDEFKDAKRELDVAVPLNYDTLALALLDKVAFDYPIRVLANDSGSLPLFDVAVFGDSFGFEIKDISILESARFKILAKQIDLVKEVMTFSVREV